MSARNETYAEARATVLRLADEAFARHEITVEGAGRWLCRQPGEKGPWYWFRIIAAPGAVLMVGDVGTAVFECGDRDALRTFLRADRGYLLTKMTALSRCSGSREAFYPGDALAWANEQARADSEADGFEDAEGEDFGDDAHAPAWVATARALAAHGELNEHEWDRLVDEAGLDVDAHSVGRNHSRGALWAVEAFRCFARLYRTLPGNAFAGLELGQ